MNIHEMKMKSVFRIFRHGSTKNKNKKKENRPHVYPCIHFREDGEQSGSNLDYSTKLEIY